MPFPRNSLMKSLVRRHRYPFGFCESEFLNAFCMSECLSMICHPINTVCIYSSFTNGKDQDQLLRNGLSILIAIRFLIVSYPASCKCSVIIGCM